MKLSMRSLYTAGCLLALTLATVVIASPTGQPKSLFARKPSDYIIQRDDNNLQTMVTWDEHSLFLNGERIMIFSGEVHPWRLPVASLWLDVFEKIKALGFNAVSFYVHWGLVEYKKGDFNFDGIRSYTPFFEAARKAGIYLIARPGPYINAETSGGGFPGWGIRVQGGWRSNNATYMAAIEDYVRVIGEIIAPEQITNGGPVILLQPENEFSVGTPWVPWPQSTYMQVLQDWFRDSGIVVPMISNDVWGGFANYVPGSGEGQVDIYGYDSYPQGFDCANPYTWIDGKLPTDFYETHMNVSAKTPNSILEFQGGAFDPWGGHGYEACSILLNHEFERVFYKNQISFSTTIFNIYMTFGGTNWGGIAYPGVYTSYDYASAVAENRRINREKYSELKLQANFLKVSPAYLTTVPQNLIPYTVNGSFTDNSALAVTETKDVIGNKTVFWVLRHAAYNALEKSTYKLTVPTSLGDLSIPQLGGSLTLDGRDSKIHVTDYAFGEKTILYSSGEIFTWKKIGSKHVLVLYGASGETHETAISYTGAAPTVNVVDKKSLNAVQAQDGVLILNYVTTGQTVVEVGDDLLVYLVDRNVAYRMWVPDLPSDKGFPGPAFSTDDAVIIKGTYLIRSVDIDGSTLQIRGDINVTETIEVVAGPTVKKIKFNDEDVKVEKSSYGTLLGKLVYKEPKTKLPVLNKLTWKYANSLPEINDNYDDSKWTNADKKNTTNPRPLTTPENLYASEYGYHTGNILWRGHFTATGKENSFNASVIGGNAFGFSVWLNSDLLGSWYGYDSGTFGNKTFTFPTLKKGSKNVITILQDHQGLSGDWNAGSDEFKTPRGILYYDFKGSPETTVSWKLTGNLGGETYVDRARGPMNEGGLYAERQGWHYPGFNSDKWAKKTPFEGIDQAGVGFFRTEFDLDLPKGYDIPLSFKFSNSTSTPNFRAQIYVNGYQFGKYANNVGPQLEFPVPEGIINHQGKNTLGVSLWAMDKGGAKLDSLELVATALIQSGFGEVEASEQPNWKERKGAY